MYEWRGKGRRGEGPEGGWTSRTLQCAVLSALPSRSGTWRGIRPVFSPLCRTGGGAGGPGGGWWLRKRCGGEERMGWRCSCQLAMALMQLTVDARCVPEFQGYNNPPPQDDEISEMTWDMAY